MIITHRELAIFLLFGQFLDLLGGLYVATDILGGKQGVLRRLTELFTYIVPTTIVTLFGYLSIFLALYATEPKLVAAFGRDTALAGSVGLGVGAGIGYGLGFALNIRYRNHYVARSIRRRVIYAVLVGIESGGFGCLLYGCIRLAPSFSFTIASAFLLAAALNFIGGYLFSAFVARLLIRRIKDPDPTRRPDIQSIDVIVGMICGLVIGLVVGLGSFFIFEPDPVSAIFSGLTGSILSSLGLGVFVAGAPIIAWRVNLITSKRFAYAGIILILVAFAIQSAQYVVVLLNYPIN
ncbi:MAG TPA: hypothetical protein VF808_06535 [Ktedonobacterales bacterium]